MKTYLIMFEHVWMNMSVCFEVVAPDADVALMRAVSELYVSPNWKHTGTDVKK